MKKGRLESEMKALDKYLQRMSKAKANHEIKKDAKILRPETFKSKKWITSSQRSKSRNGSASRLGWLQQQSAGDFVLSCQKTQNLLNLENEIYREEPRQQQYVIQTPLRDSKLKTSINRSTNDLLSSPGPTDASTRQNQMVFAKEDYATKTSVKTTFYRSPSVPLMDRSKISTASPSRQTRNCCQKK